jgi:putative ABC transport system permease protein
MLRRSPGFTVVAILTLAFGIGANVAIFATANDFLLLPLPFPNSSRIVMVKQYDQKLLQSGWTDPPSFKYWRDRNSVFEEVGAWTEGQHNLTGREGPERIAGKEVTGSFFHILGIRPILGRTFSGAEDRPGGPRVVVISHSLWQSRYGANPAILGKSMILDDEEYTIIGVLPAGFRFSTQAEDVWAPLEISLDEGQGGYYLNAIALLRPGVTIAEAQADMDTLAAQLAKLVPDWSHDQRIAVESLRDRYARDLRPAILALLAAAGLVLLIACVNIASLLLARAASRQKEIAIRRALGGHRVRIARQLLMESTLLALLGGAGGLAIAFAGVRAFYAVLPSSWQPLTRGGIDARVLAYAVATSLATVLLFGVAPAWLITSSDINESLKEGRRSPLSGLNSQSFRAALVTAEIALAALLLIGSGLLIKSFLRLSEVNLGFRPDNLTTLSMSRTKRDANRFYQSVLDRISALPQVRAAGAINFLPLSGSGWGQDINIEGRRASRPGDRIWAEHRDVSPGYFRSAGMPLLEGRSFIPADGSRSVAIISQTMARRYWPNEDPVGKRFGVNCSDSACNWSTVIGVVGDVKELGPAAEPATAMYFLDWAHDMTLVIRANQGPANLVLDVRAIVRSVDPNQPISQVHTMESVVSEWVAPQRLTTLVATLFAALALFLATVGIYGVIAYSVVRRTHEFGVRMALGADREDIRRLILGQGFKLAFVGISAGVGAALGLARLVSSLLYGVAPTDRLTLLVVPAILTAVAFIASYIPARRAMHVDPAVSLRHE